MKAIETTYNGFRFRSRLEARWAVFMDSMKVKYNYEPEAYDLDGILYLPDFWLPQIHAHLEIKPESPTEDEHTKAQLLSKHAKNKVFILMGQPTFFYEDFCPTQFSDGTAMCIFPPCKVREECGEDYDFYWCQCPHCGRCELQFNGRADRIKCECEKSYHGDKGYNYQTQAILDAVNLARGWRFEPTGINQSSF